MRYLALAVLIVSFVSPCSARPRWYKSKKFWIASAVNLAAMSADYECSQRAFDRGALESNPIFGGSRPSFGRMFAIGAPIAFSYAFTTYKMSESQHRPIRFGAFVPTAYAASWHMYYAYRAATYRSTAVRLNRAPRF